MVRFAKILGIDDFTISFVLMSFATSVPEIVLAIFASARGYTDLAIGIALGSTIVNLTLITGLIVIFSKKMKTKNIFRKRHAILLGFMTALSVLTMIDGEITRVDGFALVVVYLLYLYELWFAGAREKESKKKIYPYNFIPIGLVLMIGFTGIVIVGDVLVSSTINISSVTGIIPLLIGAILVSPLTATPELIFEFRNVQKKLTSVSFGDLIGAVGTNITFVIALSAIINPINIVISPIILIILLFTIISVGLFIVFLFSREELDYTEGFILIFTYIIFLFLLFAASLIN